MLGIVAATIKLIRVLRPEWLRVKLNRPTHLRVLFGRAIVMTLEENYVWLALDEEVLGAAAKGLRSWYWDEALTRPREAKGVPYPRYRRPKSRNGLYDPRRDPDGSEWRRIEVAHQALLRRSLTEGRAPDHRTVSDPELEAAIDEWRPYSAESAFADAVKASLALDAAARQARLARASRKPRVYVTTTVVFERNPDVVAEVLARANGICELCGQPAPFRRSSDGTPYLEVHHKKRLADGGDDTVENVIAVCPNCHREQHYG